MMKLVFKNLENEPDYNGLISFPRIALKLHSVIKDAGINEVVIKNQLADEDMYFDDITLVFGACNENIGPHSYPSVVRNYFNDNFRRTNGNYYGPIEENEKIKIDIIQGETTHKIIIGYYLKDRNAIILNQNIFNYDWNNGIDIPLEILSKIITAIKKLKIEKVNIKDTIENIKYQKFLKLIKNEFTKSKEEINNFIDTIETLNRDIIKFNTELKCIYVKSNAIEKLLNTGVDLIKENIKKIKELPFVKSVELNKKGISVYIGEVSMKHKGENIILGRFKIFINPDYIQIYNLDAIKQSYSWYDHPHVHDAKPCLSEYNSKVNDLLSSMELKSLVFFLKTYLQSYNKDSPHMKIEDWIGYRQKQKLNLKDKVPEDGEERAYTESVRKKEEVEVKNV